jgi:hypothetical protein
MAPSLTGRGWGWVVSSAAEAVSRFPGPPLEDPPTSPPHELTGAPWGERGGTTGARAAPPHGRRSVAADVPARLAQRLQRSRPNDTSSGGSAADVPPSAANGAAVEPLRAPRCIRSSAARLRAWRVTGVAIWPAPHRAQRPASRSVRQAGLVHAQREGIRARGPRARERAAACLRRLRRPGRIRVRDGSPSRGETPVPRRLDAQRNGPAPRSGDTPRLTGS